MARRTVPPASTRTPAKAARFSPAAHARRVESAYRELHARLPDIDEQTLVSILSSVLRPFGSGKRYFSRARSDGGRIF